MGNLAVCSPVLACVLRKTIKKVKFFRKKVHPSEKILDTSMVYVQFGNKYQIAKLLTKYAFSTVVNVSCSTVID